MDRTLIGLRFSGELPLERRALLMKHTLRELVVTHHATFDRLLFPYADTLLLSPGRSDVSAFGSHALLMGFDARTLAGAVHAAITGTGVTGALAAASELEYDRERIAAFLREGVTEDNHEYIGDFASLLGADVRSYDIREASRKLCSFCEQAARTDGVVVYGTEGGSVCADVDPEAVDTVIKLYRAKTGGSAVRP